LNQTKASTINMVIRLLMVLVVGGGGQGGMNMDIFSQFGDIFGSPLAVADWWRRRRSTNKRK
jgi:hypothetical protein